MGVWSRRCFHQLANSQFIWIAFAGSCSPGGPHELTGPNCEAGERVRPETLGYGDVGGIPILCQERPFSASRVGNSCCSSRSQSDFILMPFLVQIGSMAVVMRSAAEALSQFDMYVAEGKFVSIADMDGFALDVDRLREMIAKVLPGMDVSCAARFEAVVYSRWDVGGSRTPRLRSVASMRRSPRREPGAGSAAPFPIISQPRRRDEWAAYQRGSTVITVQKRWQRL